ncbi:MAG TPA: S8 family peptidase [Gemmatimonadales bacterium]|jgi:subtilisin family serine protease|nr:S8 family peptidase [Gemmatimonadales bacterium]
MRSRSLNPNVWRGALVGAGAAVILGCAQASQPGLSSTKPTVAIAGYYSFAASSARPLVAERTVSLALDRIDQRSLPLDHTYRHNGTGRGVTVYVFDGGVSPDHPELVGRVRRGFSAFPDDAAICNAHGTAVAGAIAGRTLGVAPEAEIVDVKMVQCEKLRGTIRGIVEGARWTIEDHKRHPGAPAIANWSFIADTAARIPALDSAVAALRANGIPVIVSAGNLDINACRVSPGNADGTIVVGASALVRDGDRGVAEPVDRRASGTAWGPCVDLYAPGDSVLLPSLDKDQSPTVQLWNGTSMSAGYVSGAAALFLETNVSASPDDVATYLKASATKNVVRESRSPMTRMLYVGPRPVETMKVAGR